MPRKPLIISHEFPYHIVARSNNRDWFYLPIDQCWKIFIELITEVNIRFNFHTHVFLLMNNHYHLIGTSSEEYPLPKVMEWFQRSANRAINMKAGRINHLFGGPYKASLITQEIHFAHAVKYVYRNPVTAKIVKNVEDYPYSSLHLTHNLPLVTSISDIHKLIPKDRPSFLEFLNKCYSSEAYETINLALRKNEFNFPKRINKDIDLELKCRI